MSIVCITPVKHLDGVYELLEKYELGWTPKTDLQGLVKNMVESDISIVDPKGWVL
jgi:GDP-D-mannose dehydratase